jgi:hypothetical protein
VPDFLQSPLSLMSVVGLFTLSNHFQHESGLLTVTVMGIWLGNQKSADISEIVEFKENLRVLLISILFVLLAARIQFDDLDNLRLAGAVGFLAAMLLVVRPVSVFLSCLGSRLSGSEKLFLSWMAPRGIVAAAVASIFAIRLADAGLERAEELVPVTFFFIIGTVAIYGLTAVPVARALGVSFPDPQGILFVGATPLARKIAVVLQQESVPVMLMDTNRANLMNARMEELPTHYGNALSDHALEHLELIGIGRLLALTPNPEVNSLAAQHFSELFGKSEVYRLAAEAGVGQKGGRFEAALKGRVLFGEKCGHSELARRIADGAKVKKTLLTEQFNFERFRERYGEESLPLLMISPKGEVRVFTAGQPPQPVPGWTLVSLLFTDRPAPEAGSV